MRLRIIRQPTGTIDGIALHHFQVGAVYDLGVHVSCVLLAEGWAETVADADADPDRGGRLTITRRLVLVVDDDDALRQLVEHLLRVEGYDVVGARHGADAIDRLHESCPDLILLDLQMPIMDGWQFRRAQQRLSDPRLVRVPVVLLTSESHSAYHATTLSAAAFIGKPFEPDNLIAVVQAVAAG